MRYAREAQDECMELGIDNDDIYGLKTFANVQLTQVFI